METVPVNESTQQQIQFHYDNINQCIHKLNKKHLLTDVGLSVFEQIKRKYNHLNMSALEK